MYIGIYDKLMSKESQILYEKFFKSDNVFYTHTKYCYYLTESVDGKNIYVNENGENCFLIKVFEMNINTYSFIKNFFKNTYKIKRVLTQCDNKVYILHPSHEVLNTNKVVNSISYSSFINSKKNEKN